MLGNTGSDVNVLTPPTDCAVVRSTKLVLSGIAHPSANVLLLAHHTTICHDVGLDANVRESCFLYTCASVAIAVQVLVASAVLEGTTGLVENVLVHPIV